MKTKRLISLSLVFIFIFALASCGEAEIKDFDLFEAAEKIIADNNIIPGGSRYSTTDAYPALDDDLIRAYFGDAADIPDFSKIESYEVYIDETKPTTPCEFGIFKLSDETYGDTLIEYFKARITEKLANAKMYPSVQTEGLKTAKFTVVGKYVWYCAVKGGNNNIDGYLKGLASDKFADANEMRDNRRFAER